MLNVNLHYGEKLADLNSKKHFFSKKMKLSSNEFKDRGEIPRIHRFDYGQNINPSFNFKKIPQKAKSLVLIIEDVDSPNICINWVLWNISPTISDIKRGESPSGAVIGKNFLDSNSYYGFCPLQGRHNYSFSLYALDSKIDIDVDSSISELYDEIYARIIDYSEITGYCEKMGEFIFA